MSDRSKIEWCDSTFNPWEGCTKVGPGCDHCYAEARNNRFQGGNWGPGAPRRRTSEANWRKPMKWNREPFYECGECHARFTINLLTPACKNCLSENVNPTRRRVFCASLADWLDNEVPIEWLVDLLDLIRLTPNLDWLLLTKRIGNWEKRLDDANAYSYDETSDRHADLFEWIDGWLNGIAPANVWLGATIVNQEEADRDISKLLQVPAVVRFLSMEPLLGPVKLDHIDVDRGSPWCQINALTGEHTDMGRPCPPAPHVDWVIAGGESGPHARPMHPAWVWSLSLQCQDADVPFLFKQWGEWGVHPCQQPGDRPPHAWVNIDGSMDDPRTQPHESAWKMAKVGKKQAGRKLGGHTWTQFPKVLQ